MIRKTLIVLAAMAAMLGLATPANAAGWVANSCIVTQSLHALVRVADGGQYWKFVPCGTGLSNVIKVNAGTRPYYLDIQNDGRPAFCMYAGQYFYPTSNGAVLYPTVRCSN